jgi:hypothetical protein
VTAEQIEADYDRGLLKVRVRDAVAPAPVATKVTVRNVTSNAPGTKAKVTTETEGGETASEN